MKKSTGIFVPSASGYKELTDHIENCSINGIAEYLGYNKTQMYGYVDWQNYDENNEIHHIAFEIFTNNIIFILTKESVTEISCSMLDNYLKNCDLEYEYRDNAYNIFTDGIKEKSLTIEFLSKVLNIKEPKPDGKYLVEKLGYYLYFNKGYLTSFESADGLNRWAKANKSENPEYFSQCMRFAQAFLSDPEEITNELNTQAEASVNIPSVNMPMENYRKFAELHRTSFGTINYYNWLICHHEKKVNINEFLQINRGRYQELNSNSITRRFKVNNFIYEFSGVDLLSTRQINKSEEMNKNGYVYVLINQSLKGMVKIGKTTRDPEERAKELSNSTGVPTPFTVAYEVFVSDCTKAEEYIHTKLERSGYRVKKNREFFNIPLKKIIPLMLEVQDIYKTKNELREYDSSETIDFSTKGKYYKEEALKYLQGSDNYPKDDLKAFENLKNSIELDYVFSYDLFAYMYHYGKGCEKDLDKALEYYQKSINSGLKDCYFALTYLFLEINQLNLALECRKIYKQSNAFKKLPEELKKKEESTFLETIEESKNKLFSGNSYKIIESFNLTSPGEELFNEAVKYVNFENDNPQNNIKAFELFSKSAKYNFFLCYAYQSYMLHYAIGCEEDLDKALEYYIKMINLDLGDFERTAYCFLDKGQIENAKLCWEKYLNDDSFMNLSEEDRIKKINDFEEKIKNLEEYNRIKHNLSPDAKYGEELFNEALKYFNGEDDYLQDYYEALSLFKKSAKLGYGLSYLYLGILYKNGLGCEKNLDKALDYLKGGLDEGEEMAYKQMANIYLEKHHLSNAKKCWGKFTHSWYFQSLSKEEQESEEKDFYTDMKKHK